MLRRWGGGREGREEKQKQSGLSLVPIYWDIIFDHHDGFELKPTIAKRGALSPRINIQHIEIPL